MTRNLLITTIGKDNKLADWLNGDKNFDVALVNYDGHNVYKSIMRDVSFCYTFPTFKYPGIYKLANVNPLISDYDYYFMPDEDIYITCDDINRLFARTREMKLDLSCPSIEESAISFPSWTIFKHQDKTDIVYTNFVEVMCPVFSKKAFDLCLPSFNKSQSGWGIDLVWPKIIGDMGSNIAVIHSITARHTRKIGAGNLYHKLNSMDIKPSVERKRLMAEYGISSIDISEHDRRVGH